MINLQDITRDDRGNIRGRYRFRHPTFTLGLLIPGAYFEDGLTGWLESPGTIRELVVRHGEVLSLEAHEQWDGEQWIATPSEE